MYISLFPIATLLSLHAILPLVRGDGVPNVDRAAIPHTLLKPLIQRSGLVNSPGEGLQRRGSLAAGSLLYIRQSCPTGTGLCSDGGCCPFTDYCDGGGCCPLGEICGGTPSGCPEAGFSQCPNDNYCCPNGDTCFRDSNNARKCRKGGGAPPPPPPPPAKTTHRTTTTTIHKATPTTTLRVTTTNSPEDSTFTDTFTDTFSVPALSPPTTSPLPIAAPLTSAGSPGTSAISFSAAAATTVASGPVSGTATLKASWFQVFIVMIFTGFGLAL